ncbi:beta-phosphoglucomutase [Mycoplasmopsis cynos]|uniref:beta-phosphoglucomutase n=1 Tax=Mycoplasmopsis cynos TaxID=171284 RepID=UPI002AFDDBC1|nr:beta-phosphoglucomutase [Mycoplasmopsis cynos]WQQ16272.1 beta-phosphoglucomutase [Mycoplasmopsis cynos]
MFKGFIFDLDGVITDTAKLHFKAWQKTVKELGIDYSEEENEKLRGLPRIDTLKAILDMKKSSLSLSENELVEIANQKNELYKELLKAEIDEKSILPGILEFLNKAKKHNIKLAIASSSYNAPMILKKLGIFEMFDYIVNPKDVTNGKPAPDIFIKAVQGINLKPCECIGFEDAPAGIKGIADAKIKSVAITHNSNEDFSNADLVLKSTSELDFNKILKMFD